jgi:hypothetical protein
VTLLVSYGVLFSVVLAYLELCLDEWQTFSLVGKGHAVVFKMQQCRRWFRSTFCGIFEEKEMTEVLKTTRGRWWN